MLDAVTRLTAALTDRYRIERELGQGGMATVYLAADLRHDRRVAIKVLRPELAAIIGAERFLREIKTIAGLQHPHILGLIDSGELDGTAYYVMPFVEGESLRDRLTREKQLAVPDAIRIAAEVASALDYAHRHGVVHRDIKPENILLHDGAALVADFGIALAVSAAGGTRMTETGMSLGTPPYMSPEQAMGQRELGPACDIYALGAVTYEMLTGDPPFTGSTAQAIVAKVMTDKPASIRRVRDRVPEHVEDAVLTALEKLPADRFPTAVAFAEALTSPAAGTRGLRAMGSGAARGAGTRRVWLAALGGAAVSAALAGVLWWNTGRDVRTADAEQRAQHSFTGRAGVPALSPDGTFLSYVERTCRHGEGLCRYALLVQEIGTNRPVPVLLDVPRIDDVRWTRDGTSLVLVGDLGAAGAGLFVLPRLGGTARRIGDAGQFDTYAAGDSVLVTVADAKPTTLRVVSLETGAIGDTLLLPAVHDVSGLAWSPSGDRIALTSGPVLWLVDRRRGTVLDSATIDTRGSVRWTARGDALLTFVAQRAREDHLVRIPAARRLGARTIALPRVPTMYTGRFDVARRTGRLALTTGDAIQDLWAFDIVGGRATGRQLTRGTTWYGTPAISADGASAYYLRGDAVGDNLYRLRLADGVEEALTAEHQAGAQATSLARAGTVAVYGDLPESGTGLELTRVELGSRRLRHWRGASGYNAWELPGGRLVMQSEGWSVADSFATASRPARVPDSLHLVGVAVGPDSSRIAAQLQRGDTIMLGLVDLTSWRVTRLGLLDTIVGSRAVAMSWLGADIFLGRWLAADSLPSVWRVPASGGDLRLVAMIPASCSAGSFAIGDQGRKAICTVVQSRSDIWTVEGIGK